MKLRLLPLCLLAGLAACQSAEPLAEEALPAPAILHFADREAYDAMLALDDAEVAEYLAAQRATGYVSYADEYLANELPARGRTDLGFLLNPSDPSRRSDPSAVNPSDPSAEAALMDDSFFARLVSPQGLIRIGDWYYRINKAEETVYALHADHYPTEGSDLLAQNLDNPHLLQFSTGDEVLELIELYDGKTVVQNRAEWCTEAPKNEVTDNRGVTGTGSGSYYAVYQHNTFLRYQWYGLGFELDAQVRWRYKHYNQAGGLFYDWRWIRAENIVATYHREYEVKCGDGVGVEWNDEPLATTPSATNKWHRDLYRGSKKLSAYRAQVRVSYRIESCYNCYNPTTLNASTITMIISAL